MNAAPVLHTKTAYGAGVVEIVVWTLPAPVPPSLHGFKYRLAYAVGGVRLVGYDNERGKGDHKHLGRLELPYRFVDVKTLLADFWTDVERAK
jgi:hypothetical protein